MDKPEAQVGTPCCYCKASSSSHTEQEAACLLEHGGSKVVTAIQDSDGFLQQLYSKGFVARLKPDLAIEAFGQRYPVHSLVLIVRSEYFENQLTKYADQLREQSEAFRSCQSQDLHQPWDGLSYLKCEFGDDVTKDGFEDVLAYMYGYSHLQISNKNVWQILSASCFFQVTGLIQQCTNFMKSDLTADSFLDYFAWATHSNHGTASDTILSACKTVISLKLPLEYGKWRHVLPHLDLNVLRDVFSSNHLAVSCEHDRYCLIKQVCAESSWIADNRQSLLNTCILYAHMSPPQLMSVKHEGFASQEVLHKALWEQMCFQAALMQTPKHCGKLQVHENSGIASIAPFRFYLRVSAAELESVTSTDILPLPGYYHGGSMWDLDFELNPKDQVAVSLCRSCEEDHPSFEEGLFLDSRVGVEVEFEISAVVPDQDMVRITGSETLQRNAGTPWIPLFPFSAIAQYVKDPSCQVFFFCILSFATDVTTSPT